MAANKPCCRKAKRSCIKYGQTAIRRIGIEKMLQAIILWIYINLFLFMTHLRVVYLCVRLFVFSASNDFIYVLCYMLLFIFCCCCCFFFVWRADHKMMIFWSRFSFFIKHTHTQTALFMLAVWRCDKIKQAKQNKIKQNEKKKN